MLRQELRNNIQEWTALRDTMALPLLGSDVFEQHELPEHCTITLPSSMIKLDTTTRPPTVNRAALSTNSRLDALASTELALREGQAEDLLGDVRLAVKRRAWAYKNKDDHVPRQKQNTRANSMLGTLSDNLENLVSGYNRIFDILQLLDPNISRSRFQRLKESDLKPDTALTAQLALGSGTAKLSWIWKVPAGAGVTDEEWSIEGMQPKVGI